MLDFPSSWLYLFWPKRAVSFHYIVHITSQSHGCHEIQKLWAAMRGGHGNPKLQHPAIQHREGFLNYCIPLKLHGDGVPVVAGVKTWVKLADAFSWMSLLGKGSTKELTHFIWHCWEALRCTVHEHDTYRIFSGFLKKSYDCLWLGEWPDRDMNGNLYARHSIGWKRHNIMKRLAGPYFAIPWNLAADLDFHTKFYGAPSHSSATPCFCCPVGQKGSALPLNDFRSAPPAPWMNQIRNTEYFRRHPSAHPLLNWGPITMLNLTLDWMHCKYLGSDKYLYGGVLHVIMYKLLTGTAQANMVQTWNNLKQIYADLDIKARYRVLKVTMFKRNIAGFPELRGRATEIKHLSKPLLVLWDRGRTIGDRLHTITFTRHWKHRIN